MKKVILAVVLLLAVIQPLYAVQQKRKAEKPMGHEEKSAAVLQWENARSMLLNGISSITGVVARVYAGMRTASVLAKKDPVTAEALLNSALKDIVFEINILEGQHAVDPKRKQEASRLVGDVVSGLQPFPVSYRKALNDPQVQFALSQIPDFWLRVSTKFAENAVPGREILPPPNATLSLRGNGNQSIFSQLLGLRQKTPEAADRLWMLAVEDAIRLPLDQQALLLAGAYLFNPPTDDGDISWLEVAGIIVPDISGKVRDGVAAKLVTDYLMKAIPALLQSIDTPEGKAKNLTALLMLKTKVEQYAPSLIQSIQAGINQLNLENIMPGQTQALRSEQATPEQSALVSEEELVADYAKISDRDERDAAYLALVMQWYRRATSHARFKQMLEVTEKIEDKKIHDDLLSFVKASYVEYLLGGADPHIEEAEQIATKIENDIEASIALARIGQIKSKSKDGADLIKRRVLQSISEARARLAKALEPQAMQALLNVAAVAGIVDVREQQQILLDAVDMANRLSRDEEFLNLCLKRGRVGFFVQFRLKGQSMGFLQEPKEMQGWAGTVPLAKVDPVGLANIVLKIETEQLLALAIPEVVAVLVNNPPALEKKEEVKKST